MDPSVPVESESLFMGPAARQHMEYWWRSRFSCLISNDFRLELSTVFDFATSIKCEGEPQLKCQKRDILLREHYNKVIFPVSGRGSAYFFWPHDNGVSVPILETRLQ